MTGHGLIVMLNSPSATLGSSSVAGRAASPARPAPGPPQDRHACPGLPGERASGHEITTFAQPGRELNVLAERGSLNTSNLERQFRAGLDQHLAANRRN